jgi:hypothetical protein
MSAPVADEVYTVLVNEAGATNSESDRMQFRAFWERDVGGKLWKGRRDWRVNCYREDETPERLAVIERTNAALADLYALLAVPGSEST